MRNRSIRSFAVAAALTVVSAGIVAAITIDYEDLTEGPLGGSALAHGSDVSRPQQRLRDLSDGSTFDPQPDDQFILENAGLFYDAFPDYGSPVNTLTFGIAYVPGENLTIGPLSTVTMDLATPVTQASLDLAYYENGPWGGIEFHLDAVQNGQVVATTSFTIRDLGGRDNPAVATLSVTGAAFDRLHLYATFGSEYSMPRAMIDDLTLSDDSTPVTQTTWGRVKRLYR